MTDLTYCTLDDLVVLDLRGQDAKRFLQGQLSADVSALMPDQQGLAGLHTPQGRVIAVLRLQCLAEDHLLAIVPAVLAESVVTRLRRYVLRAKVVIEDCSAGFQVLGVWQGTQRRLQVIARNTALPDGVAVGAAAWQLAEIRDGLPQVVVATSDHFVAQMLNLDLLGGISFTKGCYTGQEVIARAHYRGRVKRRVQRFVTQSEAALVPGNRWTLPDGRSIEILIAEKDEHGGQELLAVTALTAEAAVAGDQPLLQAQPAALPYALPLD
jgi:folate-binding protein YgfZ